MFRLSLILATVLAASPAFAQRVYDLPAGQYLITGEVRAIGPVISPDGPVVPPPVDPVVPPVVPVPQFSKSVTDAVGKIAVSDKRHESALKLTATYQMLGGQVKDGKIHPTNAVAAADMICPIALGSDGKTWAGVFTVVNTAVGKAGTPEATAAVFDAAATAILSTVPAAGDGSDEDMQQAAERYGFDWTTFMAFLMQLLQILLPLIISYVAPALTLIC
jgi:hypothetical protein